MTGINLLEDKPGTVGWSGAFSLSYNMGMSRMSGKLKRRLFIIAGTVAAGIGIIGIVVPVLPTTPFLLLAAICYMHGSERLYNALLRNRLFGNYISNYLEGRGMSLAMKVWTIIILWLAIILTGILLTDSLVVRIILAVVLVGVTVHIILLKTLKKDEP
jgi:uncharacterized membrane protein YbaN (DUF454 family)